MLLAAASARILSIPIGAVATNVIAINALKNFLEFSAFFVIFCSIFLFLFIHFFGIARAGATAHRRTFVVTQQ